MSHSFSNDIHDSATGRFSATGAPMSKNNNLNSGMTGILSADSLGAGAPNLLPVRFTDSSIISIPVLPTPSTDSKLSSDPPSDEDSYYDDSTNPIKQDKPRSSRFSLSRLRRSSKTKSADPEFVMKDVSRADYLKYYAKDDKGKYIGTMDPAPDCILRDKADVMKYRKQFAFREAMAVGNAPTFG